MPRVSKSKKTAKPSIAPMNGAKRSRKTASKPVKTAAQRTKSSATKMSANKAAIARRTRTTKRSKTPVTDALTDAMHMIQRLSPF